MFRSVVRLRKINFTHLKSTMSSSSSFDKSLGAEHFDIPYRRAKLGPFLQTQPSLGNQFSNDALLQSYLKRHLPGQVNTLLK